MDDDATKGLDVMNPHLNSNIQGTEVERKESWRLALATQGVQD